jgi:hypothetical protein
MDPAGGDYSTLPDHLTGSTGLLRSPGGGEGRDGEQTGCWPGIGGGSVPPGPSRVTFLNCVNPLTFCRGRVCMANDLGIA